MEVTKLIVGPLQANCYLLREDNLVGVIDPGAEPHRILQVVERQHWRLVWIVLTHGHADHAGAAEDLRASTGAPVLAHREEARILADLERNLSSLVGRPWTLTVDDFLADGQELRLGRLSLRVRHTPGHTPGGICIVGEGMAFTGDTLFAGSIGRTDLPGGDFGQLLKSIRSVLMQLPDATVVKPGHGPDTTVGRERRGNPFVR